MDLTTSVLLVGVEHIVKPSDGDLLVTMLVRRRATFTPTAFRDR